MMVSTHSRPKAAAIEPNHHPRCRMFHLPPAHTRRRGLVSLQCTTTPPFQLTAAQRRLPSSSRMRAAQLMFQLTAAQRRLHYLAEVVNDDVYVSTHSRPKAAANYPQFTGLKIRRFNSQPPNGGCATASPVHVRRWVSTHSRPKAAAARGIDVAAHREVSTHSRPKAAASGGKKMQLPLAFQLTAAQRRLRGQARRPCVARMVSTHSRPKAAANRFARPFAAMDVSTHSRPKAAANPRAVFFLLRKVSTHSRPKAAAVAIQADDVQFVVSTHSRPKAAAGILPHGFFFGDVSTHSRPKAAAPRRGRSQ